MNRTRIACGVALAALGLASPASAASAKAEAAKSGVSVVGRIVGLPDWSGVWDPAEGNLFDPSAGNSTGDDVGQRKGPSRLPREYPPYKPEWEALYQKELDSANRGDAHDPTAACVPPGMPRVMTSPYAWEFMVVPGRVVFLKEYQSQIIRVFTDGRPHPKGEDLDPSYNGHSIGHWEGDTLVVDTVGMRGDTWFDRTGARHSDQVHMVQRMRKVSPDLIENQITIDDPVAFTKPWRVLRHYKRAKNYEIMDFACSENNRNPVDASGKNTLIGSK